MLLEIFTKHNKQLGALIEKDEYAKGTRTHYEMTLKHTKAFLAWKYKLDDIHSYYQS